MVSARVSTGTALLVWSPMKYKCASRRAINSVRKKVSRCSRGLKLSKSCIYECIQVSQCSIYDKNLCDSLLKVKCKYHLLAY